LDIGDKNAVKYLVTFIGNMAFRPPGLAPFAVQLRESRSINALPYGKKDNAISIRAAVIASSHCLSTSLSEVVFSKQKTAQRWSARAGLSRNLPRDLCIGRAYPGRIRAFSAL